MCDSSIPSCNFWYRLSESLMLQGFNDPFLLWPLHYHFTNWSGMSHILRICHQMLHLLMPVQPKCRTSRQTLFGSCIFLGHEEPAILEAQVAMLRYWIKTIQKPTALVLEIFTKDQQFILDRCLALFHFDEWWVWLSWHWSHVDSLGPRGWNDLLRPTKVNKQPDKTWPLPCKGFAGMYFWTLTARLQDPRNLKGWDVGSHRVHAS